MFDAESILNVQVDQPMATQYEPIPEGEYTATIRSVEARNTKNGSVVLDVQWAIDDPALAERLNRQELLVRQSIFLDLTPNGALDLGPNKNVRLGRLREAVGQNQPGQPWNLRMLEGAGPARIGVRHRTTEEGQVFEEVYKVAKL